jgi:hypothetical protein
VNDKLERILKEMIMAKFKILSWYSPGVTEENYKKPQSE